jgi:hypothetical protein
MLFSLSQEASQKLRVDKNDLQMTNVFVKFSMKAGLVKQIRVCDRTQFYKFKRIVCCCADVDPDDVCFLFEGRELEPLHRRLDVNMRDGAVVVVLERSLVHPTVDSVLQDLATQQRAPQQRAPQQRAPQQRAPQQAASTLPRGAEGAARPGPQLARAQDPEAILAAVEHEGWVKATPKLETLVRDFCGYGAPPQQDLDEDLDEDLPLSARKHAPKRRRLQDSS